MFREKQPHHFLAVEDNDGDYLLLEEYLQEKFMSLKISRASNFKDVKTLMLEGEQQFNAILLDLTLPDLSGKELIQNILQLAGSTPLIVLTGFTDFSFAVKSLALGVSDYLLKDDLTATTLHKSIIYNIERNKSLLSLKESEQRYSDLFQLSPLPMWVYDVNTFAFLDVNLAAIEHYGYSKEEFLGMTIRDIRPASELPHLEKRMQEIENDTPFTDQVFIHQKKNGELMHVDIRHNNIIFRNKKAKVILAHDITERLNHIRAIELQNTKLREIAWTQSHVVRAPLARMMGILNLIIENHVSDEEKNQLLGHLQSSAFEFDEIIRDIVKKSQAIQ